MDMKVKIPKLFRESILRRFPSKSKIPATCIINHTCMLCAEYRIVTCSNCPFSIFENAETLGCLRWIKRDKIPLGFILSVNKLEIYNVDIYLAWRKKAMKLIEWIG